MDTVNKIRHAVGINNADNQFSSVDVVSNKDGSILERIEWLQNMIAPDYAGLAVAGVAKTGMTASKTTIVSNDLIDYGDDFFNNHYYMQVLHNDNSAGNSPEHEVRKITDYVSTTGTFTVDAFGANVEAGDILLVLHEVFIAIGRNDTDNVFDSSSVAANAAGSILERLQYLQGLISPDLASLSVAGICPTGMVASTTAVVSTGLAGYGDDFFNNQYYVQILHNTSVPGAAPEKEVRKVTDYDSATGTFTCDAFSQNVEEGDIILVLHEVLVAIGRNDANNTFDSSAIVANADGSVLERAQYLQDAHDVPAEDAVDDVIMSDVVGKKSDTIAGTSIIALAKQVLAALVVIDAFHDVPVEDTADDIVISDVVGKKSDTVAGTSIVALAKQVLAALVVIDAFHDVPVADTADNVVISDVVGNKTDTVAGDSVIALAKQLIAALVVVDAFHDVPSEDSVDDVVMSDVVGKKTDTVAGTSIVALAKQLIAALAIVDTETDKIASIKTAVDTTIPGTITTIDGYHDIPAADGTDNNQMRDVIGNKADTVAGLSIVGLIKALTAALAVVDTETDKIASIKTAVDTTIPGTITTIDAFHDVAVADAATNLQMRDVIGNKTDTVAGTSIVALAKQLLANLATAAGYIDTEVATLLGYHTVPTQDDIDNLQMRDVIGNKTDTVAALSIVGLIKALTAAVAIIDTETDKIAGEVVKTAAIQAVTDLLPDGGAFTTEFVKTAAIKTETDKIPAEVIKTAAIKAVTDVLPDGGAFTTEFVKTAAIKTETDKIAGEVVKTTAIQARTDLIPDDPADASDITAQFLVTTNKIDAFAAAGGMGAAILRKTVTFVNQSTDVDLFIVTGTVIVRLIAVCKTDCESVGACNIGVDCGTLAVIADTACTDLEAGDIWFAAIPATNIEPLQPVAATFANAIVKEFLIGNGQDIALDVEAAKQVDSGVIDFYLTYIPLSSDGAVTVA